MSDVMGLSKALVAPRLGDDFVSMRELLKGPAEDAEATGGRGNGCRQGMLATCVGALTPRVLKLRSGSFSPER